MDARRSLAEGGDAPVILAFWSAVDLLRPLVLLYCIHLYASRLPEVEHPLRGWTILTVLAVWTALTFAVRMRPRWWLALELAIGAGAILATAWVDSAEVIAGGAPTVPGMWPAATVLSWAVLEGPLGGLLAAVVVAGADVALIHAPNDVTIHNIVILLLLGTLVGYCADLARTADRLTKEAAELRARTRERERLARDVHDGVLQALSLVHRRGLEIGGETAELGRMAAEQEHRLRELIRVPVASREVGRVDAGGDVDLAELVSARARDCVTVVATGAVVMSGVRAHEVDAAVGAALDNVRQHAGAGAKAWVLLERVGDEVQVLIRDNGAGMTPGRAEEARAQGRLGISGSIVGRMADLGGTAEITSSESGTRVELRAPLAGRTEGHDG